MRGCRLARRIASMTPPHNSRSGGVSGRSWATKVFHCLVQSFCSFGGGWAAICVGLGASARDRHGCCNSGQRSSAGVRSFSCQIGARRAACWSYAHVTPLLTLSLVTKGRDGATQ